MSDSIGTALYGLPIESHPAASAKVALDKLVIVSEMADRTLEPKFWRKLLGGASKDHARSVIALLLNDTKAIRDTFQIIELRIENLNNDALSGNLKRLISVTDNWRNIALEYENATYGADQRLILATQKMKVLSSGLQSEATLFVD